MGIAQRFYNAVGGLLGMDGLTDNANVSIFPLGNKFVATSGKSYIKSSEI